MSTNPRPTLPTVPNDPGHTASALLEIFAPARAQVGDGAARPERRALWRADSIHRAKNFAQLAASLGNLAEHPRHSSLLQHIVPDARVLARLYDELGHDDGRTTTVPCTILLRAITERLIALFGQFRAIQTEIALQPLSLPPDQRRALVLICSELVINALKYAFPPEGGTLSVRLELAGDRVMLCVEDDGLGVADHYVAHHGGGLLDRLAAMLGTIVIRTPGADGRGYCVTIDFTVDPQMAPGSIQ